MNDCPRCGQQMKVLFNLWECPTCATKDTDWPASNEYVNGPCYHDFSLGMKCSRCGATLEDHWDSLGD